MELVILFLSICLSSTTIVYQGKKQESVEEASKSIELDDTQSRERHKLGRPAHVHNSDHFYKNDLLSFYGTCRRKFAMQAFLSEGFKSMVCSPVAALMPLAKLALGAEGKGKEELLKAIGLSRRGKISGKYRPLIRELKRLRGVDLQLASKIFVAKKYHVRSKFQEYTENIFGSSVDKVYFKERRESERTIDSWISRHTKCKFNYRLEGHERSIILNAISFQAKWAVPFKGKQPSPFYTPNGVTSVSMMTAKNMFNYYECNRLHAQLIEFPYQGHEASFLVILPNSKSGLPDLLQKIQDSPSTLTEAMARMTLKDIKVVIPKFTITTQLDLQSIFKSIGIYHAFSLHRSGLTKIVREEELVITWAYQVTKFRIDEEGTTVSSATDVQIRPIVGSVLEQKQFKADRPFLFYVKALGEQIFSGIYTGNGQSLRESIFHVSDMNNSMKIDLNVDMEPETQE